MKRILKDVSAGLIFALMLLLLCAAVSSLLNGCATLAPGADPLVVRVEQGQQWGDATVDFVLHFDNADRGFWRTNAPAFHNFCEWLRTPTPYSITFGVTNVPRVIAMELNVQSLKETYKASKTAGNSNALYEAFTTFSAAVTQANSWSNIVTFPTHP